MITLRQLEFVIAVGKHKHFKRAAEDCSVSQSALSLGIAALEEQLNIQVFERNNKQVLITPIGAQIIERGKLILAQAHDLQQIAQLQQQAFVTPMKIGLIPTIAPYLLPKVLPALQTQHPDFKLHISENQSERLIEKVRSGSIDTAIIALPYTVSGLHTFEFWDENFFAVVHKDDPLAQQESINTAQLADSNLLMLGEGHCLTDQVFSICKLSKSSSHNTFTNASLHTLIQMSLNNMGITLVPEMSLDQLHQQNGNAQAIPIAEKGPHRRIAFVTRANYARVDEIQQLSRLFYDVLSATTTNNI